MIKACKICGKIPSIIVEGNGMITVRCRVCPNRSVMAETEDEVCKLWDELNGVD